MNSAFRLQPHQCKLLIYMDRMTCTLKSPAENRDRNGLFGYEKWRRGRLAAQEEIAPNRANTGGTSKKIPTDKSRDFYEWWSWGDLNPRPQAFFVQFYMCSRLIWISPDPSRSGTL